jgi:hypothetical protein
MENKLRDSYWCEEEQCFKESVRDYYSEDELCVIFKDELEEIIPEKIPECEKVIERILRDEIIPQQQDINKTFAGDEISRLFWTAVHKIKVNLRFTQACEQLERFKKLQRIFQIRKNPNSKQSQYILNYERKKEIALQKPILQLYDFKKLKKVGDKHIACCPFHDDSTPSFYIYHNNSYHCFGCEANGNAIDFTMRINNFSYKDAIGYLTGVR